MALFLYHALCGFFACGVFKFFGFRSGLDYFGLLVANDFSVFINSITGIIVTGPALPVFDFGNDPVGRLNVKTLVRLHYFFRKGMDTVDHDMDMEIAVFTWAAAMV